MEKLTNVNQINTNTIEGRYLMAALAKITTESQTDKTPFEVLEQIHELQEKMYSKLPPLPNTTTGEYIPKSFKQELESLINRQNMENMSDTPDFILTKYLMNCLASYNMAVIGRDKFFGVDMWAKDKIAAPSTEKASEYNISEQE